MHWLFYNRGLLYKDVQMYEEALQDLTQAININSELLHAYVNRSGIFAVLNNFQNALEDLHEVIDRDPHFTPAYISPGALMAVQGQMEKALYYFEKAAELGDPTGVQQVAYIREIMRKGS